MLEARASRSDCLEGFRKRAALPAYRHLVAN